MKVWWQRLNNREQILVVLMSSLVSIFILYSAIWQPLNDNLASANKKLIKQKTLLTWVTENTERYQKAKGNSRRTQGKGSLSGIVNNSAGTYQLTITRMQPQGDDIQVWLDSVPFTQLLFWLEHLVRNENIKVKAIDLMGSDNEGEVTVRRLQLATK